MLSAIGQKSVDDVVSKTVPSDILFGNRMDVDQGMSERDTLALAIKLLPSKDYCVRLTWRPT
jgi:glycine dehydrogenase